MLVNFTRQQFRTFHRRERSAWYFVQTNDISQLHAKKKLAGPPLGWLLQDCFGVWDPQSGTLLKLKVQNFRVCCFLAQVLFQDGKFQWKRLENLIGLAKEGSGGLDLSDTVRDGAKVLLLDDKLRRQLLLALTEDNRLHVEVSARLSGLVRVISSSYTFNSGRLTFTGFLFQTHVRFFDWVKAGL